MEKISSGNSLSIQSEYSPNNTTINNNKSLYNEPVANKVLTNDKYVNLNN